MCVCVCVCCVVLCCVVLCCVVLCCVVLCCVVFVCVCVFALLSLLQSYCLPKGIVLMDSLSKTTSNSLLVCLKERLFAY